VHRIGPKEVEMARHSANRRREFLKLGVAFGVLAMTRPLHAYAPPTLATILPPNAITGSKRPPCMTLSLPPSFSKNCGSSSLDTIPFSITASHMSGMVSFTVTKEPDAPAWSIVGPDPIRIEVEQTLEHSFLVAALPGAPKVRLTITANLHAPTGCWGFGYMVLECA
jgi:hypothetical protein